MSEAGDRSKHPRANPAARRKKLAFLRARYGDQCWVCGGVMIFPARRTNQKALATIDHVTPVYDGGTMALTNLRLAHKSCNTMRGADREGQADPNGNPNYRWRLGGRRIQLTAYAKMFTEADHV